MRSPSNLFSTTKRLCFIRFHAASHPWTRLAFIALTKLPGCTSWRLNLSERVCSVSHTRRKSQHTLYRSTASGW